MVSRPALRNRIRAQHAVSSLLALLALAGCTGSETTPLQTAVAENVQKVAEKYSHAIILRDPGFPVNAPYGTIDGQAASVQEVDQYLPLFLPEWNLYPPQLVKKSRLQRVVLCKKLTFAGQARNAVPDFANRSLYLDVVRGREAEGYMRKVIHHEFFHIIDFEDDGVLYADERWAALNPRSFKYGNGGKNAQDDPTVSLAVDDTGGFLNKYSKTGVEEDKAEVFAHMMVEPKRMEKRAKKDPVLRAKMQRMRELIEDFAPEANKTFWEEVSKAKRPGDE